MNVIVSNLNGDRFARLDVDVIKSITDIIKQSPATTPKKIAAKGEGFTVFISEHHPYSRLNY